MPNKIKHKFKDKIELKKCRHCGKIKSFNDFSQRKNRNNNPDTYCKECRSIKSKNYYYDNIEKCKKRSKEYFKTTNYSKKYLENNREKRNKLTREWIKNNREKINKYFKKRYYDDITYNITRKLRSRFYSALKRCSKKTSVIDLIGCNIDFLKKYLNSKFDKNMNWDLFKNGKIHIDHIKPLASYNLTNIVQQREAWHYSNLQPLWKEDNIKKGAKILA